MSNLRIDLMKAFKLGDQLAEQAKKLGFWVTPKYQRCPHCRQSRFLGFAVTLKYLNKQSGYHEARAITRAQASN